MAFGSMWSVLVLILRITSEVTACYTLVNQRNLSYPLETTWLGVRYGLISPSRIFFLSFSEWVHIQLLPSLCGGKQEGAGTRSR